MTSKEVEHFLIENDWTYTAEIFSSYWSYRGREYPAVSDELVQENPDKAFQYVKDCIANFELTGRGPHAA